MLFYAIVSVIIGILVTIYTIMNIKKLNVLQSIINFVYSIILILLGIFSLVIEFYELFYVGMMLGLSVIYVGYIHFNKKK